jgi:protein tyrosine phosphatase type 4A
MAALTTTEEQNNTNNANANPNGESGSSLQLANKLSQVNYKNLKFIIMDRPTPYNLPTYLRELKKAGVTAIVRVCEETYDAAEVEKAGISIHEIPFEDGTAPPKEVMSKWRSVVKQVCDGDGRVAIHCVAGLGRAPVLVAIALIDKGLDSAAAVDLIRKERRGAINRKQLDFLRGYKPPSAKGCCIM